MQRRTITSTGRAAVLAYSRLALVPLFVAAILTGAVAPAAGGSTARTVATGADVITYLGQGTIYAINADGSDRQALLSGSANDTFAWSADGESIAFTAGGWGGFTWAVEKKFYVAIAAADGTNVRRVTPRSLQGAGGPSWSPDAQRIAFSAWNDRENRWGLYTIGVDGRGLRPLTHQRLGPRRQHDGTPDWSPDGRWIVFDRRADGQAASAIMAIRPDGTGLRRIATVITGPQCSCPDWSPDNSKIAYQASPNAATAKYPEIYVIGADGTGAARLTHDPARDENPDWSPDGSRIAFYSERPGNAEIYTVDADGSHLTRVTHDPWYSSLPRWKPKP